MTLPPGRGRLSTKPAPTGSEVSVNTIGTVRVARRNGPTTAPLEARMTSGTIAANSAAQVLEWVSGAHCNKQRRPCATRPQQRLRKSYSADRV